MAIIVHPSGLATSGPTFATREFIGSAPIYWVNSVTGSDSNAGTVRTLPKATVFGASGAVSVATGGANVIVCESTHTETISSASTWSALGGSAGCILVSLGSGTARATFTSSVAGVALTINVTDVCIENCYFAASTAATTSRITVTSGNFQLKDCQMDLGANDATDGLLLNYTTGGPARVSGCTFKSTGAASGTTQVGLRLTGASPGAFIEDCTFDGGASSFSEAAIDIDTATADRFVIRGLTLQNYSLVKVATTIEGWISIKSKDATSRVEYTE